MAIVGANFDDDNGSASGSAYIFEFNISTFNIAYLKYLVENSDFDTNVENSLCGPLKKVLNILTDGNDNNDDAACGKLDEFIANVESKESSGKLDSDLADEFIDRAEQIQDDIGCL